MRALSAYETFYFSDIMVMVVARKASTTLWPDPRIRRFVDYKYWAEIEDLGNNHDKLDGSYQAFRTQT